jgi:hypothetical protein
MRPLADSARLAGPPLHRDFPHVREREVVSGEDDRLGHPASLEASRRSRICDSSTPGSSTPAAFAGRDDALRDEPDELSPAHLRTSIARLVAHAGDHLVERRRPRDR